MHATPAFPQLAGCYVISLRPQGAHAPLRRAAARLGARTFALSPWRMRACDDTATREALRQALSADVVVFTSPPAVAAAAALQALAKPRDAHWLAVGSTTAAALTAAGVDGVQAPSRMDSEGLLAMPAMAALDGATVGLVTAPGGRGMIAAAVVAAGAHLQRANVYARVPIAPSPARVGRLLSLPAPWLLPLSSGEALARTLDALPPEAIARLRRAHVTAASERLAGLAREAGFERLTIARDARPASLLAAALDGYGKD